MGLESRIRRGRGGGVIKEGTGGNTCLLLYTYIAWDLDNKLGGRLFTFHSVHTVHCALAVLQRPFRSGGKGRWLTVKQQVKYDQRIAILNVK
jgi:hypothetical protein